MREQQPTIVQYINQLIQRLHENCGEGKNPIDIMSWYNYTTFDIIGDLVWGESFGCLDNSDLHPWIKAIFDMLRIGTITQGLAHFPRAQRLLYQLIPKSSKFVPTVFCPVLPSEKSRCLLEKHLWQLGKATTYFLYFFLSKARMRIAGTTSIYH